MNDVHKYFVPPDVATRLKEVGFDEPMIARFGKTGFRTNVLGHWYYHNSGEIEKHYIGAPTYDQVFEWFEAKRLIVSFIWDGQWDYKIIHTLTRNMFPSAKKYDSKFLAMDQAIRDLLGTFKKP